MQASCSSASNAPTTRLVTLSRTSVDRRLERKGASAIEPNVTRRSWPGAMAAARAATPPPEIAFANAANGSAATLAGERAVAASLCDARARFGRFCLGGDWSG